MSNEINHIIGLKIYKGDWTGAQWTITGVLNKEFRVKEFESAYDFEEFIQKHIKCNGIEFDSEYCQFFAYAKTKASAVAFVNRLQKHIEKVKKML